MFALSGCSIFVLPHRLSFHHKCTASISTALFSGVRIQLYSSSFFIHYFVSTQPCCLVCCVFAVFCVIHFLCSLSSRSVCALHHSPHSDVHCNRTPRYRFASLLALDSASFFVLCVPSLFTHVLHSFHPISASAQSAHHTVSHTIINSPILLVFASVYSPLTQFPRFCFTPSLSPSPHH